MQSSIREQKFAITKLSILRAFVRQIELKPLESISIKDICRESNIATATFFLYFSHKTSILDYFIQLWSAEITWWIERKQASISPKEIIYGIFDYAGLRAEEHPHLMAEVSAWMARRREEGASPPLSRAELALAFPDFPGVESVTPKSLKSLLALLLDSDRASGSISKNADLDPAVFSLLSIFFSTPLLFKSTGPGQIRLLYRRQLDLFWSGFASIP